MSQGASNEILEVFFGKVSLSKVKYKINVITQPGLEFSCLYIYIDTQTTCAMVQLIT